MSCCGNLEDSFRRNADDRGLVCMFPKEVKTVMAVRVVFWIKVNESETFALPHRLSQQAVLVSWGWRISYD